jgi:hypothetical protein
MKTFITYLELGSKVWKPSSNLYKQLGTCSRIHRSIRSQIDLGCVHIDDKIRPRCPCCQFNPKKIISTAVDASMSFKGIQCVDHRAPLYGEQYIMPDLTADEVANDKRYKPEDKDCDQFKADNILKPDKRFDQQGIAGSICQHHIVGNFIYLVHGKEAYIFALKLLLRDLDNPDILRLLFKYDICCNFLRYLKVTSSPENSDCFSSSLE